MKAIELNRLDLFFLTNCDRKGTTTNMMYQVVELTDDEIIANGLIQTKYGAMNMNFYLPDWTEVEQVQLEDVII